MSLTTDRAAESLHSSIAQSVERMTVNHDVTGSSPVRGANRKQVKGPAFLYVYVARTQVTPA